MAAMHTIGITGGIGSGKSVVSRVLRCNGFIVYDCDSEARRIMVSDENVKSQLQSGLGAEVYTKKGELNRSFLAQKLFSDSKIRRFVNDIVHNAVGLDIRDKASKVESEFFIESAILYSSGLWELCDEIWFVDTPKEERIKRVAKRDNLSNQEISRRMEIQDREYSQLKTQLAEERAHQEESSSCKDGNENLIIIANSLHHPILLRILDLSKKGINNQQIYNLSC